MPVNRKIKAAFFWLLLVSSDTVAQLILKLGAVKTAEAGKINYLIFVGYSFYAVSFIAWMQILKTTRLSIALSAASVLYITIAVASHFLMEEPLTPHLIIGTILIATGVFILGWSEGKKEGPRG